jgi:calcineurin-like phosphoesterase family protein
MKIKIDLTQGKIVGNVFFTSDFHLFHKNVLKFDNRPFTDVDEMHVELEKRWNEVVGTNDTVIYLGDLSFARREDKDYVKGIMHSLNGTIHYVLGNHDDRDEIEKIGRFESVSDYLEIKLAHYGVTGLGPRIETLFCCMHYPIYSWNKKHHGSIHLHGHCHGNLHHGEEANFYVGKRVMDVGCNIHNYTPVSYIDILNKLGNIELDRLVDRNN